MNKRNIGDYAADVIALMKQVTGLDRVYLHNAPKTKTFPYAVIDIRGLTSNRLVIEADIWAKKGNELNIMNLADSLDEKLDGYVISNTNHSSQITSNNDFKWVADDDENLLRVNMSFNATYLA